MVTISGSLWPYVLMTLAWVAVCGFFLHRAWKFRHQLLAPPGAPAPRAKSSAPERIPDSQAGSI
jgi:hypothetical protein